MSTDEGATHDYCNTTAEQEMDTYSWTSSFVLFVKRIPTSPRNCLLTWAQLKKKHSKHF